MKRALITGVTGQDGSYLAELLLEKGYFVTGLVRHSSSSNTCRIDHFLGESRFKLIEGDLLDPSSLFTVLDKTGPDEIYNLAAMSHVKSSFSLPEYTMEVNGLGVIRLLEAVRRGFPEARIYQASTSELFGKVTTSPQNEKTAFYPRSPYGIAKLAGYWSVVNYREAHGIYACNGILFNHESPRRGEEFVSRKISMGACKIASGSSEKLYLGNLDAKRDWGYAKEFVYGMWQMLQLEKPEDFVLATGKTHTVRQFVEKAFDKLGIDIEWQGKGEEEKGIEKKTGKILVEVSKEYFRPSEVELLLGDASLAKEKLGWEAKTSFDDLVALMVKSDYEALS